MLSAPLSGTRAPVAILALLAAASGQDDLHARVAKTLARSRPVMLRLAPRTNSGALALLCLALTHDGVRMDEPKFATAIARLEKTRLDRTYGLSLRLMVMANLREYPDRTRAAKRDLGRLLLRRGRAGFTYTAHDRAGTWDLSNTQYAALGMRAAVSLGVAIKATHWQSVAKAVLAMQAGNGGFGYRPSRSRVPYTSMTVAGIAVLEVCRQHADGENELHKKIDRAVARAWAFMAKHSKEIGQGLGHQRNYYFHYGLERAAILSDKHRVGRVEWYAAGVEMLLEHEVRGGGWAQFYSRTGRSGKRRGATRPRIAAAINTAFAVLFLRRRFQKRLGPITHSGGLLARTLPAQASARQIAATVRREIARGYKAVPDLLRAMRSPIEARRVVAAKALQKITGKFGEYSPYHGPEKSAAVIKQAEAWWLKEGRRRVLR